MADPIEDLKLTEVAAKKEVDKAVVTFTANSSDAKCEKMNKKLQMVYMK